MTNNGLSSLSDERLVHLERTVSNATSGLDYARGLLPEEGGWADRASTAAFDANELLTALRIEMKERNNRSLDEYTEDGDD